jgi:hypothetical protein
MKGGEFVDYSCDYQLQKKGLGQLCGNPVSVKWAVLQNEVTHASRNG